MIDAGTAYKRGSEDFYFTDVELTVMERWEQDALNELLRNQYPPFDFKAWRQIDPPAVILRITYPVPVITLVEAPRDHEPDRREPVDRTSRAAKSYWAANTSAPEARFSGWL